MNLFPQKTSCSLLSAALVLAGLATGGLSAAGPGRPPVPPDAPRTPNIILIVADDLGYGDLGCYGQKQIQTPNLDRLAAEGTRFTSFYAGSTVGAPSRSALLTGQHTGHTRIRGDAGGASLAAEDDTLALELKGAGYRNGLVGTWGLGNEGSAGVPGEKGFDDFVGYLDPVRAQDYYAPYLDRFDTNEGLRVVQFPANENGSRGAYLPDQFNKSAINFIRINKPDPFNRQRPIFLLLAQTIPRANNEFGKETGNGMQVPDDKPYAAQTWPPPEKNKAAMITRLDKYVGEIVAKLKEYKQETNTLILFTSDNGPHQEGGVNPEFFHSAGPLRGIKGGLYEGGIRVPLIAWWPGRVPAGRVSAEPWAFWDLFPTLIEVAHGRVPKHTDGISYLPTLLGGTQTSRHEFFYWEFHERGFQQAVRTGDWKAVRIEPGQPLELYNLASDPGETNNVAAQHADVVARIESYLKTARTESPQWPVPPVKPAKAAAAKSGE